MMMADNLRMATLLPEAAMRVSRPAEPLSCVVIEEKVSDYKHADELVMASFPLCAASVQLAGAPEHTVLSMTSCARALS